GRAAGDRGGAALFIRRQNRACGRTGGGMKMDVVALICARGGSKGVPGKNIRPLAGRPLIAWAIGHALQVKRIGRVIVSTDAPEIAAVAREAGAEVPFMRPVELA